VFRLPVSLSETGIFFVVGKVADMPRDLSCVPLPHDDQAAYINITYGHNRYNATGVLICAGS
jgi:hypothetical protein